MSDTQDKPAPGAAAFTAEDAMAFMQRMWNPFAMPAPIPSAGPDRSSTAARPSTPGTSAPGATGESARPAEAPAGFGTVPPMLPGMLPFPNPAAMFAALDPAEIERKIGELKVIEGWLAMSLNLIQMSIKTFELQLASLEALRGAHAPAPRKSGRRTPGG